jgi:hypothetical protein
LRPGSSLKRGSFTSITKAALMRPFDLSSPAGFKTAETDWAGKLR